MRLVHLARFVRVVRAANSSTSMPIGKAPRLHGAAEGAPAAVAQVSRVGLGLHVVLEVLSDPARLWKPTRS